MHEAARGTAGRLRIIDDLQGSTLAAVVYSDSSASAGLLRLNRALIAGDDFDRVLLWARREIASGRRLARLLADELDALP